MNGIIAVVHGSDNMNEHGKNISEILSQKRCVVTNSNGEILLQNCGVAHHYFQRLRGLLFSDYQTGAAGLVIAPCRSIHTIGMPYAIDVAFFDKNGFITAYSGNVQAGNLYLASWRAYGVLEVLSGTIGQEKLQTGEKLLFKLAADML